MQVGEIFTTGLFDEKCCDLCSFVFMIKVSLIITFMVGCKALLIFWPVENVNRSKSMLKWYLFFAFNDIGRGRNWSVLHCQTLFTFSKNTILFMVAENTWWEVITWKHLYLFWSQDVSSKVVIGSCRELSDIYLKEIQIEILRTELRATNIKRLFLSASMWWIHSYWQWANEISGQKFKWYRWRFNFSNFFAFKLCLHLVFVQFRFIRLCTSQFTPHAER